ncbi:M23 family metallopeptidase [uncultured Rhodospira sp.]|uniref:M23 family metallopeptidase n=1 Tax=uncultured Rhodospira sp. TaxID=1936189 RepID=UPI002612EAF8|nr:M23 family metallopeptidase [uncultured Rhodospira sp.]
MNSPRVERTPTTTGTIDGARHRPSPIRAKDVIAGLAMAAMASLVVPAQALATDGDATDLAVVAALDGAAAPLPPRKPEAITAEAAGASPEAAPAASAVAMLTPANAPPVPASTSAPVAITARVDRGDTLIGLLIDAGVDRVEAHKAVKALQEVFDPRRLRPGHRVNIRFAEPVDDTLAFLGFDFEPSTGTQVIVAPDADAEYGFSAEQQQAELVREVVRFGGPITLSLYQAAVDAGVSDQALSEMVRILSYDIDFQRDIQKDDTFEVLYERFNTEDGRHVRDGRILFTALTNGGHRMTAYAFEMADGHLDYFNEKGQGVRKPLMRTPIDGARLSSNYGMRKHPILGYSRMHTGVDFAAPTGTPIYAAGDGVVDYAGRKGGYGKYVRIRHNSEFSTAYAHMSRIQVRAGERVEQGEVIGRVGSTGMSTGPHLHYEIIRNGAKVNPMGVRFQPAIELAGADLERFQSERQAVDTLYARLRNQTELASTAGRE